MAIILTINQHQLHQKSQQQQQQQQQQHIRKRKNLSYKRKRGVQFSPLVQVTTVESVKKEDLWYKNDSFQSFKHEMKQTARAYRHCGGRVSFLDRNEFCLVGLEDRMTSTQNRNRRHIKHQHMYNILELQHLQRCQGIVDPNALSALASEGSKFSGYRAHQNAVAVSKQ